MTSGPPAVIAAPNPYQSQTNLTNLPPPPFSRSATTQPLIDIGDVVSGEAAAELALDSSISHTYPTQEWSLRKFGRVYMVRTKTAPKYILALKTLYNSELVANKVEKQTRREIEIQQNLRHPSILHLYGFLAGKGELYKQLSKLGSFSERRSARYIDQMADALIYLHDTHPCGSVHAPGLRKITLCGTWDYLTPEMVEGKEHNEKVDYWALGALIYEFMVGAPPFEDRRRVNNTYRRIARVDLKFPSTISADAKDLISKLLQYDS
ncbi:kinase-like domain-containing protein [Mycena epipterygia]|nr:kinase-like domain-containing protein [Mycena epipterygia]